MNEELKYNIGKFVCFDKDGEKDGDGFCWGLIKGVCEVNTMGGKKAAFVLGRRVCSTLNGTRVSRFDKDTLLRVDSVNIEKDIISINDFRGEVDKISDNDLFLRLLEQKKASGAFDLGFAEEIGDGDFEVALKNELKKRTEK
jgi:hypothetical protein